MNRAAFMHLAGGNEKAARQQGIPEGMKVISVQRSSPGSAGGVAADELEAGMKARTPPMQDAALIEVLNQATSLELYQLSALVKRLITDPRRIVAVRKDLHLGQVVRLYDGRRDTMCEGRARCAGDAARHTAAGAVEITLRRHRAPGARCATAAANTAGAATTYCFPETHAR
jgi:hypothetical protein